MHNNKNIWPRHWSALLLLSFAGLFPALALAASAGNFLANDLNATDRIIVHLRPQTLVTNSLHRRIRQLAASKLTYLRTAGEQLSVYRLPAHMPLNYVRQMATKIARDPNVLYAEPDVKLHLRRPHLALQSMLPASLPRIGTVSRPNDPYYQYQWDLSSGPGGINAPPAWRLTTGSSQIVTAVLDSGARFEHEDLRGRLIAGYNFSEQNFTPVDPGASEQGQVFYHGTNISGVIGAAANNGRGIAGINWISKILIVRLPLDAVNSLFLSDAVDAMRWAAGLPVPGVPINRTPARVLNISWGQAGIGCPQTFVNAVSAIRAKGGVVVVATGNDGINAVSDFPTSCPGVISVAALDRNGNRSSFSDYGADISIGAPGERILLAGDSKLNPASNSYTVEDGTSFAAPHVVGVISLMLSVNPNLTPAAVASLLKQAARPFPSGANCSGICQVGILDADRAVALAAGQPAPSSPQPSALRVLISRAQAVQPGAHVNLIGVGRAPPGMRIVSYLWRQLSGPPVQLSNPRAARPFFIAPRTAATLVFHLTITDSAGHVAGAATEVHVS